MIDVSNLTDDTRLNAVRKSGLLDSSPDRLFDQLASIAAQLLDAPSAFVTVIDADRQFFKSAIKRGTPTGQAGSSVPLTSSLSKFAVAAKGLFLVGNTAEDPSARDILLPNDLVAYAGVALKDRDGEAIGALCVVDSRPRSWSSNDVDNLSLVARNVEQLIEEGIGAAEGSAFRADDTMPQTLIKSVEETLRAAGVYDERVSGKAIDIVQETQARAALVQCLAVLRRTYEKQSPASEQSYPELTAAVGCYLETEHARKLTARAFRHDAAKLDALRGAIARHADAADALRIMAIDHGATL
ncbi:MAG: GAF domain-containing protein [Croceibacterium sp.]